MKRLYLFILLLFLYSSTVMAKGMNFIDGMEDIPLMKGLIQKLDKTVSFGNEESRFVEAYLISSKVGFKKVESFYKESLPQLGWTYQGTSDDTAVFYRDSESLSFHKESNKPLRLRVTIKNRI